MNVKVSLIVMIVLYQPAWLITLIANNLFLTRYYWMDTFKGLGASFTSTKIRFQDSFVYFLAAVAVPVNF